MMTKNRASKSATRERMAETAEPYTLAKRAVSIEEPPVEVWIDEYEGLAIFGTHEPAAALNAVRKSQPGWLNPNDPEYDELLIDEDFYRTMSCHWTRPLAQLEGEFLDKFEAAAPGLIPYMFALLS